MDEIISPLVLKRQSLSHIFTHHKNAFTDRNIDLLRKMKYNPRKKSTLPIIKESTNRLERTFENFFKFIEDNSNTKVVEMDTVHSTDRGKVLLTFMFRNFSLMLAFIIDNCSQVPVKGVIDKLYEVLGHEVFKRSFPVILTDSGSELKIQKI